MILGSFTDRAFVLSPPVGMPPSASQLTSQAQQPPGLDRALWTARADCPRHNADATATAGNVTVIAAPGAGLRLKIYGIEMGTSASAPGNGSISGTLGGSASVIARGQFGSVGQTSYVNKDGLEMDVNTGLAFVWTSGTITANVAYDVVPA